MKTYIVAVITTWYSEEKYLCLYDNEKHSCEEEAVDDFLCEYCFCDEYEIKTVRQSTKEEIEQIIFLLTENNLWEAQEKIIYTN